MVSVMAVKNRHIVYLLLSVRAVQLLDWSLEDWFRLYYLREHGRGPLCTPVGIMTPSHVSCVPRKRDRQIDMDEPIICSSLTLEREEHLETNSMSKVILEKQNSFQLVKKFPAFYGTQMFITEFTEVRHWALTWATWIQYMPSYSNSLISIKI
jgi:hypothetical protein